MEIRIRKGDGNVPDKLICKRLDGSVMESDLPPNTAYHDLAHFVVETELGISEGFWGMILQGFHLQDYALANEERPFQFTEETYRAEYLATLLQSAVYTGVISPEYQTLLRESALANGLPFPELPEVGLLKDLIQALQGLSKEWAALNPGMEMRLTFEI